jgi:hypothetical protein
MEMRTWRARHIQRTNTTTAGGHEGLRHAPARRHARLPTCTPPCRKIIPQPDPSTTHPTQQPADRTSSDCAQATHRRRHNIAIRTQTATQHQSQSTTSPRPLQQRLRHLQHIGHIHSCAPRPHHHTERGVRQPAAPGTGQSR